MDWNESYGVLKGGPVFGLVSEIDMASRIAKAARHCRLPVHNFDQAEALLRGAREKRPVLILLDLEKREAEAFKVLNELRSNADLKGVAAVGYVSGVRESLKDEARRAGCDRVYGKTELIKDLEHLFARYAQ